MHPSLIQQVEDRLREATSLAFPSACPEALSSALEIAPASQVQYGDYQCNSAMKLARQLKLKPRDIAQAIVDQLATLAPTLPPLFEKVEIAGPGFINLWLDGSFLVNEAGRRLLDGRLGIDPLPQAKRVVIDFSSPNIAKEMHVGHLRSTIIGDSLARLLEFLGYSVLRINHIGDWGTSFGMLIAHMKQQAPAVLSGEESCGLGELVSWYKSSKERFDSDPLFKKEAQEQVVALQAGEEQAMKAWEIICHISEQAYRQIYELLEVELVDRGESYYNDRLAAIVADLEQKRLLQISDGARCVYVEGFKNREGDPLPLIVQKADGGYNYATTDLAALCQRIQEEKGERLIYVTDAGQATHFAMVFEVARQAGYWDPTRHQIEHVPFGMVLGPDGKRFRTRSGATERLIDLLEEAIDRADSLLLERNPELEKQERHALAKRLGLGAVKYADLSCHRISNYLFSYEKMLRFEGNTAAFLLYSYVRANSIQRRIGLDCASLLSQATQVACTHPSERLLLVALLQLHEQLLIVARELTPNRLCDHLYGLAEKFNGFFRDCRVEGSPEQNSRLLLCHLFARTMALGLHLLGLQTVEKM